MSKQLLMGNHAIALGAIKAGVGFASGYPGTPSTEILETLAKHNPGDIHVEWSVNEKSALEVAAGAAYAGVRSLVTMKQVGLNVASDPLMSLAYVGVKGGMVIISADDPGPISSQTEQDTRTFAAFSKLPVFDPASPEEAYEMIGDAFEYSEKYGTPVLFRPTTRVCHGCADIEVSTNRAAITPEGFVKDPKWVIFPRASYMNHIKLEKRRPVLGEEFSDYRYNTVSGSGRLGIAFGGISCGYAMEALTALNVTDCRTLKVATPYPFPERLALQFLDGLTDVLVLEELDPVIERELLMLCGKHHINVNIRGKLTDEVPCAGELSAEIAAECIAAYLGVEYTKPAGIADAPAMAVRPPVLCAGCPHRASFYAVKQALKGQKAVFSGDIGCYTLGNAMPLDMVDTCLCMGAGVTIAQGLHTVQPDCKNVAFIGDSTFFASGLTGIVNAVYNKHDITVCVLDNSTTAMTGHQPHPGTGKTLMGEVTDPQSIPTILRAMGVGHVAICDPLKLDEAVAAVKEAISFTGVSVVIFKSPCIAVVKPDKAMAVDSEKCIGCARCIRELGCPALSLSDKKAVITLSMCTGCTLCAQVCPVGAIAKNNGGEQ
ncbi:MAG: indolepyruvate ferredoxin oxidoreductase subunit alpha [Ruminococcaceae bacterium]|nr:indolepyruvate ferredoxin oxidoreductase subunit alpha [Oscillospiraceae bacterium]